MKKTEDLISSLSSDLTSVTVLESPMKRFIRWCCVAVASLLVGIAFIGLRDNFGMAVKDFMWWMNTLFMTFIAFSSAVSAFVLSAPGMDQSFLLRWMPIFSLLGWGIAFFFGIFQQTTPDAGAGLLCIRDMIVIGVIPGVALFVMVIQGVVFKRPLAGIYCFLAIAGLGSLGTQFICASDSPLHLLVWHFLPVFVLGLIGSFVGNLIFKRS